MALGAVAAARSSGVTASARSLIPILRRMVAAAPLNEPLHAGLIDMLTLSGQRAEAITVYHTVRAQLAEELGLDPGPDMRAAHARILAPDAAVDGAPTAARMPAPAQLPAGTPYFTGREAELAEAIRDLPSNPNQTVVISAIGGMAGIGKTTLAVHWAHRIADRYPDGQLYVNLRGFDLAGVTVPADVALRNFLTALGTSPTDIPADLDAAAALYRSRLAGTRTLVVLDNARDADHVRPLLPGTAGCQAIVTSRNRLAGLVISEGAHSITLGLLSADESRTFLAARVGADRLAAESDATTTIITACRGLPLALAIVAARASTNPSMSLDAVAAELSAPSATLDALAGDDSRSNLRIVFSWSYQALSADAARLFRQLAIHPGPDISTASAISVGRLTPLRTRALLSELVAASLLTEPVPGRYTFHDLVRAYADECLTASDDRTPAVQRLIAHYVHSLSAAERPFAGHDVRYPDPPADITPEQFDDRQASLRWFRTERPTIVAVFDLEATIGADRDVAALAHRWGQLDYRTGDARELLVRQQFGAQVARRIGDPRTEATILRYIAWRHLAIGNDDEADDSFRQMAEIYGELDDNIRLAMTHREWATVWLNRRRFDEMLEHCYLSVEYAKKSGDANDLLFAYDAMGVAYQESGDLERAIEYGTAAVEMCRQQNEVEMPSVLMNLGEYHLLAGAPHQAVAYFEEAATALAANGDDEFKITMLILYGDALLATGDIDGAREAWETYIAMRTDQGSFHDQRAWQDQRDDARSRLADLARRDNAGARALRATSAPE